MNTTTTMNTTRNRTATSTDPQTALAATRIDRKASGRRQRRLVAVAVAVLAATTLGLVTKPGTSDAASGVTACFKTRTGMVVGPVNTNLELYINGQWTRIISKPNSGFNGCVSYWMTGWYQNYYARIRMTGRASSGDYFNAISPLMALPGNLHGNLGTAYVSCIGYCYGV
jgi:hypothetical protein